MRCAALVCGLSHSYAKAVGKAVGVRNDQHNKLLGESIRPLLLRESKDASHEKVTANLKSNKKRADLRGYGHPKQ